jgi:hypothetical protein
MTQGWVVQSAEDVMHRITIQYPEPADPASMVAFTGAVGDVLAG